MLQLSNNAKSTLGFGITDSDTTLQVISADASKFPVLALPGDYFIVALANNPIGGGELKSEFVKVTQTDEFIFTIERAQEGSTAQAFDAGDRVELRLTAGSVADLRGDVWGRPVSGGVVQTPSRISDTSFSLPGDFTEAFEQFRSVRAYQTTDAQGFVVSSVCGGGITTVTVENMVIDTGLALVEFGMDVGSAPKYTHAATADQASQLGGQLPSFYTSSININYDNASSKLIATKVKTALDEIVSRMSDKFDKDFLSSRGDILTVDQDNNIKRLPRGSEGQILSWDAEGDAIVTDLSGLPVGTVAHHAGTAAPSGWLIRNGAAVSRSSYADLFAIIGTKFGAGNGSTTFNLPDDRNLFDRGVPSGGTVGTYQADEFKSHTHNFSPALGVKGAAGSIGTAASSGYQYYSISSTGGVETRPKNRHYLPIIKY